MVLEIYNLPYTLYKAETAQAIQNLFVMQDRAAQETYSASSQNQAKADQVQVHQTEHAEGSTIHDKEEGFGEGYAGEGGEGKEEQQPPAEEQKKEPSPDGKGQIIDFKA